MNFIKRIIKWIFNKYWKEGLDEVYFEIHRHKPGENPWDMEKFRKKNNKI